MAWLEIHQSLPNHRKTLAVADALDISPAQVVGHLVVFWLWAVDNAPDGRLEGVSDRTLARVAQWESDPSEFVAALVKAGFLEETEGGLVIHDWDNYAGRLIEKRRANAERMRTARAKAQQPETRTVQGQPTSNVHDTCNARAMHMQGLQYSTLPYSTESIHHPSGDEPAGSSAPGSGLEDNGREALESQAHTECETPPKRPRLSSDAKAVADRLKHDLLKRGQVLPRDWHLKAYSVAQRLLANGVTVQEIDETREWCWSNPYWAARLDSMYALADAINERRRKASARSRDAPIHPKSASDPYLLDLARLRNELMGGARDADTGDPDGHRSGGRGSEDPADLPERSCGRGVLPVA